MNPQTQAKIQLILNTESKDTPALVVSQAQEVADNALNTAVGLIEQHGGLALLEDYIAPLWTCLFYASIHSIAVGLVAQHHDEMRLWADRHMMELINLANSARGKSGN